MIKNNTIAFSCLKDECQVKSFCDKQPVVLRGTNKTNRLQFVGLWHLTCRGMV